MTAVPTVTPVKMPDDVPIVATALLLLLHVPPVTGSVSVDEPPAQTVVTPFMGATGVTVIVVEELEE